MAWTTGGMSGGSTSIEEMGKASEYSSADLMIPPLNVSWLPRSSEYPLPRVMKRCAGESHWQEGVVPSKLREELEKRAEHVSSDFGVFVPSEKKTCTRPIVLLNLA